MKIIITAGGTEEAIDKVRSISNTSTGKLGSIIAHTFYNLIPNIEIIYICSYNAIVPNIENIKVIKIKSVSNLQDKLVGILENEATDAVIHAMAVSDYTVSSSNSLENIVTSLSTRLDINKMQLHSYEDIHKIVNSELNTKKSTINNEKKISSKDNNLIIFMEKTPKVINIIKKLQPNTILVGFKLLVGTSNEELLQVGHKLLLYNRCDFVLANDLENITGNYHKAILISPDTSYISLNTKEEIAKGIVESVMTKFRGEKQ